MADMRRPSDRADAWDTWRSRLLGMRYDITSMPHCGWFKAKRFGQWTAVQIDLVQDIDPETGELLGDEHFCAFVGAHDVFYEQAKVEEIWLRCAANPISEAEAERLLAMPPVSDLTRSVIT